MSEESLTVRYNWLNCDMRQATWHCNLQKRKMPQSPRPGQKDLVTAYIAAAVKAKVTLIERHRMGGDCLNTGCVPSKALICSAKFLAQARRASEFGIKSARVDFDFAEVMDRVQRVVKTVEPHDSVARYSARCRMRSGRRENPLAVDGGGRR